MGRFPQKLGEKGSLKWIQRLINGSPELLNKKIRANFSFPESLRIEWRSPLASDDYAEYRDQTFLDLLDISTRKKQLKAFWPKRGPQWDALGKSEDGQFFLVEAKSHIPEMLTHLGAKSPESIEKIHETLSRTKQALKIKTKNDWSAPFYQYANRIAHLYFLRKLNGVPAYLIFVYFLNDKAVGGPGTIDKWTGAIRLVHAYLGIGRNELKKYMTEVFVDIRQL